MKHLTLLAICLTMLCTTTKAQWCATEELFMQLAQTHPELLQLRNEHDKHAAEHAIKHNYNEERAADAVITIPVVIYIVHDGTPATNITMQRIESQMQQLNNDFAPHGVQFCYAKKDVATTTDFIPASGDSLGVFRINSVYTNVNSTTTDGQLKALSTLSPNYYLRIFVVKSIIPANVAGYAYYPGAGGQLDGIVVEADFFGSSNYCTSCTFPPNYDKGYTTTHEVGHYLGLYHTFQGGCAADSSQFGCQMNGDRVCDTPPSPGTFGCPTPAPFSCGGNTPILTNNYMEYTHDACKNSFTPGQGARMQYHAAAYRASLIGIQNLISTGLKCASLQGLHATMQGPTFNGCQGRVMKFNSLTEPGYTYRWYFGDGDSATGVNVTHIYAAEGRYPLQLVAESLAEQIREEQTVVVFITPCEASIQCSYNVWRGQHTSLDFSSGEPVPVCDAPAIIDPIFPGEFFWGSYRSDTAGNRLFGIIPGHSEIGGFVFNANNQYNLADTLGPYSHLTIFPCPQTSNRFCVLASKNQSSFSTGGLEYSIIEAANGNVGCVPGYYRQAVPTPVSAGTNPLTAAIPSCSANTFWVLAYARSQNKMWVYRFDTTNAFILQQQYNLPTLQVVSGISIIATAPNGREFLLTAADKIVRMAFNPATGQIVSHTVLNKPSGLEFDHRYCYSPNSRYLYGTLREAGNIRNLYQFDLQLPDPIASRRLINAMGKYSTFPKMGADKKIYVPVHATNTTHHGAFHLGVINYPDRYDAGNNEVGYNRMGPNVLPENCGYMGLDNNVPGGFVDLHGSYDCDWRPGVPRMFGTARNSCRQYTFTADDCFSASWNFGDPASGGSNTSTLTIATHMFSQPGHYLVTVNSGGQVYTDSVFIDAPAMQLVSSPLQMCPTVFANYSVAAPDPQVVYTWKITNGVPATIANAAYADVNWQNSPGQIQVIAYDELSGCADTTTQTVTFASDTNVTALLTVTAASCAGSTIQLQTINNPTVTWYRNGVQVPGHGLNYLATENGQYSVVVNNGCMDRHSNQVNITLNQPQVSGQTTALCPQQIYTYSTPVLPSAIYNWVAIGGAVIAGQSSSTVQVQWAGVGQRHLILQQTLNGNTCADTLAVDVVICTGMDNDHARKWVIYPNPASSVLHVECTGAAVKTIGLKLVNALGQVVLQQNFIPQGGQLKQQLSLQGLASGVYTLQLLQGQERVQQRVLIVKGF